jgi:hypothetical protein
MAQKARRAKESRNSGADLMNDYLYGEDDFADGQVLRFLALTDGQFAEEVCGQVDDEAGARRALARSGRSPDECREFSAKLRKSLSDFALLEADEGRMPPGFRASAIKFFYNVLMMPVVYTVFRRAERKRGS